MSQDLTEIFSIENEPLLMYRGFVEISREDGDIDANVGSLFGLYLTQNGGRRDRTPEPRYFR